MLPRKADLQLYRLYLHSNKNCRLYLYLNINCRQGSICVYFHMVKPFALHACSNVFIDWGWKHSLVHLCNIIQGKFNMVDYPTTVCIPHCLAHTRDQCVNLIKRVQICCLSNQGLFSLCAKPSWVIGFSLGYHSLEKTSLMKSFI